MIPYQEALTDVKARVAASRTSFHAGMILLPQARREAMYALYAFCREVDDIADDSPTHEEAVLGLQKWSKYIATLFQGTPSDTITTALAPAVQKFGLVQEDFQTIIDGMEMDSVIICAPDAVTLDRYCDSVASAVGRISVRIFGDSSPKAMEVSYHLGRALQLTNILRDLAEDAARDRLYLPEELLTKHGILSRKPSEVLRDPKLCFVCRDLAEQATTHFAEADKTMRLCKGSAMRPAKIMRGFYNAILDRLIDEDWKDLSSRVRLSKGHKIWLTFRHLIG